MSQTDFYEFIYIVIIITLLVAFWFTLFIGILFYSTKKIPNFYRKILYYKYKHYCEEPDCKNRCSKNDCTNCHGLGYYPEHPDIKCDHASTTCTECLFRRATEEEEEDFTKQQKNILSIIDYMKHNHPYDDAS